MPQSARRISAFSVILIMIVLMVIGAAMLPLLKVQYRPSDRRSRFTVSFSWPGASARVVEQEVTSRLEGVLNSIDGVVGINAYSSKGEGSVTLYFNKNIRMDAARFEAATRIRQIYDKLPRGVSYPYINMSLGGSSIRNIMTYTINAGLPPAMIVEYAERNIVPILSRIEGVEGVSLSGADPFEWEVRFDPDLARDAGITANDISNAIRTHVREDIAGSFVERDMMQTIRLKNAGDGDLENIPIKNSDGRLYFLRDLATVQYREALPVSYFRINGLNAIYMNLTANEGINTIEVAEQVRGTVLRLSSALPENYTLDMVYDSSEDLDRELDTILFRSVLSLIILLVFVWVVSRSLRYLLLIALSIVVNLLISVIFYYLLGVEIHLYSLAGLTVSLGIIIDTSIVMIDHFSYYRNKRVFTSILGALLTTIAALLIIFFLPDNQKNNLIDFVWVIIVNLSVSVLIALLFIPSLLEKVPVNRRGVVKTRVRGKRRLRCFTMRYERFILWSRRHRWIYIVLLVMGFGIPIHLLPDKVGDDANAEKALVGLYNKTIGGAWYQDHKNIFEIALGGSFRYFSSGYRPDKVFREPEPRKSLDIHASMPEGSTVHQLNEVLRQMENYLSRYDQIDMYRTRVSSYDDGHINVTFKRNFEDTAFPLQLREEVIRMCQSYGGASWWVQGIVEQGFSNYVGASRWKNHAIRLTGYNYDMLYRYADLLTDSLTKNRRVTELGIFADENYNLAENEFFINYDREKIARTGLNLGQYYNFLQQQLFDSYAGSLFDGKQSTRVMLASSQKEAFDLWHVRLDMVMVDSVRTRLDDVGSVTMRRTGNNIVRNDQEYQLVVGFNFIGPWELADRFTEEQVDMMNEHVLAMGNKAHLLSRNYRMTAKDNWRQAGLLLLVIVIIYILCAIIFESIRKPFVILLMIPVGFIGLFLTFAIGEFTFDQGGFAAMVMMCGIVVNAGIYMVNENNIIRRNKPRLSAISAYVKAYNRKIVPTLLTILSTVLGLIPFLFEGSDSVFWFAFAVGVMGAMLFSIIALVIFLPVFLPFHKPQTTL